MKVFVIGNGPSALNTPLGEEIDNADVVVRINDFQTKGYEKFVGSKTDILFTCRLNEYLDNLHTFKEVIVCLLMNPLDGVHIPQSLLESENISKIIDWDYINKLTPRLSLAENCYPSTGCTCILEMVQRYKKINILGFDHFRQNNRHYYSQLDGLVPFRHDGPGEEKLVKSLRDLNLVTIY